MTSKAQRPAKPHPAWCNVPHKVGSSRSRQVHKRIWRSRKSKFGSWKAELYPSEPRPLDPRGSVSIRMFRTNRGRPADDDFFWWWPDLDDAKKFAEDLLEMVAHAEAGRRE